MTPIHVVVPDLFDAGGGIARISRAMVRAICESAFGNVAVHVLRDGGSKRDARYLPDGAEYRGYGGDRGKLARAVIAAAWKGGTFVFGHVNLATLALVFPPTSKVAVVGLIS